MQLATAAFDWKGAKVTAQKPNGFSQTRFHRLQRLLTTYGTDGIDYDDAMTITFLLANTVSVDGSLGFLVPLTNTTHPELIAFIRGVGFASADLLKAWDDAIGEAMATSNDAELLPPEELSSKNETAPVSSSSDSSNAA